MSEERDEERDFKVSDRRRFDAEGQVRPEAPEPDSDSELFAAALPEIDFSTFIISLSTSAIMHLGDTAQPDGEARKDLNLAKQTIDILGMLREKTQGNLGPDESKLLDEMLFDLRLRYVAATG